MSITSSMNQGMQLEEIRPEVCTLVDGEFVKVLECLVLLIVLSVMSFLTKD